MKKLIALLFVLLLPCVAMADGGILPLLPATDAISFGQVTSIEPVMAWMSENGWYEAYINVAAEQYYAFSNALADAAFVLVESSADTQHVHALVRSSDTELSIDYYPANILAVTYTSGLPTTPETVPSVEILDAYINHLLAANLCMDVDSLNMYLPADVLPKIKASLIDDLPQPRRLTPENISLWEQTLSTYPQYIQQ